VVVMRRKFRFSSSLNESQTCARCHAKLMAALDRCIPHRNHLRDDGSTDGSLEALREIPTLTHGFML